LRDTHAEAGYDSHAEEDPVMWDGYLHESCSYNEDGTEEDAYFSAQNIRYI
jgi:hypothetical protein